jgi:hypothetical protein
MVASFFIRQFLRRQGSARRSLATTLQRECITNEITVWLHVAVRAQSLHHRSSVRTANSSPRFATRIRL